MAMRRVWITPNERALMLAYGAQSAAGENLDPKPVLKLFTPGGPCIWLLTELDIEDPDIAFGLCDLGVGFPEMGSVRLSKLMRVRGPQGFAVMRDFRFSPTGTIGQYATEALKDRAVRA